MLQTSLLFDSEVRDLVTATTVGCDTFSVVVPGITGTISCLSSALIIVLILRSPTKFTTIYHRLMFGMSCVDILASVAMGLSSFPKPPLDRDICPSGVPPTFGNIQTCEAQGFLYIFGLSSMFAYNGMLCVYYTCAIAFQMKEKNIAKYVEPLFHICPLSIGLGWAVPPLIHELYNPTSWDAWCSIALGEPDTTVVAARVRNIANMDLLVMVSLLFLFALVFICFGLIIWRVFQTERKLYGNRRIVRRSRLSLNQVERSHRNSKLLLYQALAYFISYMVTLTPLLIRSLIEEPIWLIRLSFVFMPLQGLFNMLIFVAHKVHNYRRAHEDAPRNYRILVMLFKGSVEDPLLFSRISLINIHEEQKIVEIELANERSVEMVASEYDPDISSSEDGAVAFAGGDSVANRDNLSGFSNSPEEIEGGEEKEDIISKGELGGFSNVSLAQSESNFVDDISAVPPIDEDEALSYGKAGSVFSSIGRLGWSSKGGASSVSRGDLSGFS